MQTIMDKATAMLWEMVGQDSLMALATRDGEGVASRTVNVFTYGGDFYFVTENHSNKFAQIKENPRVALSKDAIQISGRAQALEHPLHPSNQPFRQAIEAKLPQRLDMFAQDPAKRLVQITPEHASLLSLKSKKGYVIHFQSGDAQPIQIP